MKKLSEEAKQVRAIIRKVRKLLGPNGENWTKRADARVSKTGEDCPPNDSDAKCWCVGGAVVRVASGESGYVQALDVLELSMPSSHDLLASYNDAPNTRFRHIRNWLKRAEEQAAKL